MKKRPFRKLELLCISDIVDPLIYSETLYERYKTIDAVLSCGDLKNNYYEFIVSNLNVPLIYVLGNHSQHTIEKNSTSYTYEQAQPPFCGGRLADGKSVYLKEQNLIVAGLGGSMRYSRGKNQYTESEMLFRVVKLIPGLLLNRLIRGRYLDILLTHAPPRNINDGEDLCHRGFRVFRWFLRFFRPKYMVHGHIHLYNNMTERRSDYLGIPVINAYRHFILNIPGEGVSDE